MNIKIFSEIVSDLNQYLEITKAYIKKLENSGNLKNIKSACEIRKGLNIDAIYLLDISAQYRKASGVLRIKSF